METKQKLSKPEKIRSDLGYSGKHYEDRVKTVGGLALWWTTDVSVTVIDSSKFYIDVKIVDNSSGFSWFSTFVYGNPYVLGRNEVWNSISNLRKQDESVWNLIGDFNAINANSEKSGVRKGNRRMIDSFNNFINNLNLIQFDIGGGDFSWSNNRVGEQNVRQILDKAFCSTEWMELFPNAYGIFEAAVASDHCPIVFYFEQKPVKGGKGFQI